MLLILLFFVGTIEATDFEIHGTLLCKFRKHAKYQYSIWIYDTDFFSGPDQIYPIEDHGEISSNVTRVWKGYLNGDEVLSGTYSLQAKVWHDCERYYYKEYKLFYIDFKGTQCETNVKLCVIHFDLDISDIDKAKVISVVPKKVIRIFHIAD